MEGEVNVVREFVKDNLKRLLGKTPDNEIVEELTNFIIDDEFNEFRGVKYNNNELHIEYVYEMTYVKFGTKLLCDRYLTIKFTTKPTIIETENGIDVVYCYDILTGHHDILIS